MIEPIGKIRLRTNGEDEERVGEKRHDPRSKESYWLEDVMADESPLPITCDVRQIHPPYFSEFIYNDILDGMLISTLSAEITSRVREKAASSKREKDFDISVLHDKYIMRKLDKKYKKVLFLAGSNSCNLMDQQRILSIMDSDDDWMIKPHPIEIDDFLRDLGRIYGYHRIIDKDISGMDLLYHCDEIATTQCSELYIVARLMGKPVYDVTRYDRAWLAAYHSICRLLDNSENDYDVINNILMSNEGGFLLKDISDSDARHKCRLFFDLCMEEREKFKMITTQRLNVSDKTFPGWENNKVG